MSKVDITRAWKDDEYFLSMSEVERALVPDNPAGLIELDDEDLSGAAGGTTFSVTIGSWITMCDSVVSCYITICPVYTVLTVCPVTEMAA